MIERLCTCGHSIGMHIYMGCMEHTGDGADDSDYCACRLTPDDAVKASLLVSVTSERDAARAELSALRARVEQADKSAREWQSAAHSASARAEQAERERDENGKAYSAKCYTVTELQRINSELLAERDEARARVALSNKQLETIKEIADEELRRGSAGMWHQVEAEAHHGLTDVAQPATLTPRRCGTCCTEAAEAMREACANLINDWPVDEIMRYGIDGDDLDTVICRDKDMERAIRALPLPSCDCNPLKPTAAPLEHGLAVAVDPQAD